jgi:chromosome partitioning protein
MQQIVQTNQMKDRKKIHQLGREELQSLLGLSTLEFVRLCQKFDFDPDRLNETNVRILLQGSGCRFPDQAEKIAFMMCKGGVGKTTSCLFLAQRLSQMGARVLVIDTDPQGNLTAALVKLTESPLLISEKTPVIMDVLSGQCSIQDSILSISSHLKLIPSTALNSLLERKLMGLADPVQALNKKLLELGGQFDFILMDSAPALSLINASLIVASDRVILPMMMSEFSMMGLKQTIAEILDLEVSFKIKTKISILVNQFSPDEKLGLGYLGQLIRENKKYLLRSIIRKSSDLQMASLSGQTLSTFANSSAREDFDDVAMELLNATGENRTQEIQDV